MKRILFVLAFIPVLANAQLLNIRHVKGIKSVDVNYGITEYGKLYSAGYVKYFSNSTYLKGQLFYEKGEGNGLNYTSTGADVYFAKTIVHSGFHYYLNGIGGAHLSVDNTSNSLSSDKIPSTMKSGILLGIENEYFISDRFVLIGTFSQRALLGNNFGNYRWFAQVGIRYNF
jgi:hypothetical protein